MVHRTKPEAIEFARSVVGWLEERDISVLLDQEDAKRLGLLSHIGTKEEWNLARLLITLGGDGTILTAARRAAPNGIPILGVHLGRFGFIAETHPEEVFPYLETILQGDMVIEDRLMIKATIERNGACFHSGYGLNDVIVKSKMSRLVNLKTRFGNAHFATFPADGIVVATPTGSTGYALSAGGPLIEPNVQALVFVPVCPHTLSARPMILPASERIEIEVEVDGDDVVFAIDGVEPVSLETGDTIVIERSEYKTRLIMLDQTTFYTKVRNRYLYGERINR